MKVQPSKLYALLAVGAFGLYLFYMKKEKGSDQKIQGIDLSINPEMLADGLLSGLNINPIKKELLRQGTKSAFRNYYDKG